jgi:RNA polymerase sigma factor (sigma-70 family)
MLTTEADAALTAFIGARSRLFGIAYRMLGSAVEAEDIVQEVWLRWQAADRSAVREPSAFLVTVTTRLAINQLLCARSRHESCVGTSLPEPIDDSTDPSLETEREEALEVAILILLEKLGPKERAAYILREAFNYPYSKIAEILRSNEVNCRQLIARARKHLSDGRRTPASAEDQRTLLEAFSRAAREGNAAELEGLFAPDVAAISPRRWAGVALGQVVVKDRLAPLVSCGAGPARPRRSAPRWIAPVSCCG